MGLQYWAAELIYEQQPSEPDFRTKGIGQTDTCFGVLIGFGQLLLGITELLLRPVHCI